MPDLGVLGLGPPSCYRLPHLDKFDAVSLLEPCIALLCLSTSQIAGRLGVDGFRYLQRRRWFFDAPSRHELAMRPSRQENNLSFRAVESDSV